MITTTTPDIHGRPVAQYLGVVAGEAILGVNIFRDMFAGIRDIVGGRAGGYEKALRNARELALDEAMHEAKKLGADAIVGIDFDYETITGSKENSGSMLMVTVSGTAVKLA